MARPRTPNYQRYYYYTLDIKFEQYELECVPDFAEVCLPAIFSKQYGDELADVVDLFDGHGNRFEVRVVRRSSDLYLAQGWRNIGKCLGLHDGGWVRMIYVAADRFFIECRDRVLSPPFCPSPPRIFRLGEEPRLIEESESLLAIVDPSMYVGRKPTIVFTLHTRLASIDVSTSFLHLPYHFCEIVFPKIDRDVTLVDEDGEAWACSLIFPPANMQCDVLLRGWGRIMAENEFPEGSVIKIQVPVDNTQLLFFTVG